MVLPICRFYVVHLPAFTHHACVHQYDGVTAGLKVNADLHDPLLCVSSVWDVASGDLSLPATWNAKDKP